MSRKFTIKATDIGGDVEHLDLYYNAITSSNLIVSGADISILTSSGYSVTVPDNAHTFYGYASGGLCDGITGSLVVNPDQVNVRFFNVYTVGSGEVKLLFPYDSGDANLYWQSNDGDLSSPVIQTSVDYSDVISNSGGNFTINTQTTYPSTLTGFYKDAAGTATEAIYIPTSATDTYFTISSQDQYPEVIDIYVHFSS